MSWLNRTPMPPPTDEEWADCTAYAETNTAVPRLEIRTVDGWPSYSVTSNGEVRGPQRVLKPHTVKGGYQRVCLRRGRSGTTDARARWVLVHILVLETFVGPKPPGMEACHNNGNAGDNRLSNLRWDTHSSNMRDAVQHGTHNFIKYGSQRWSA